MAGEALTPKFMLGTATLMLGAQADLFNLGVGQSIGLVKNVVAASAAAFTELTQGTKNSVVASVKTKDDVTVNAEMYEYSIKNLTYGVSLDGSAVVPETNSTTTSGALATSGSPPLTAAIIPVTSATGILVGKYLSVSVGSADQVFIRKVTAVTGLNVTVNAGFPVTIPAGSRVQVVNMVPLGSTKDNPYLSAKIVGKLSDNSTVTILIPKCRVSSGISVAFKTDNFDHIPFSLTVYDVTPADPNYAFFLDEDGFVSKAQIFAAG